MMKTRIYRIVLISIIIGIIGNVIVYIYNKHNRYSIMSKYTKVKNKPLIFVYDTTYSALNPALYVDNMAERIKLKMYYDSLFIFDANLRKGIVKRETVIVAPGDTGYLQPITIPVEVKYMPPLSCVYLIRYSGSDSIFAEVMEIDTVHLIVHTGWVYSKMIHRTAPSPAMTEKYINSFKK